MAFLMIAIVPTLYKSGVVSVYEYLENRFDASSRFISFVFQISRSVATGVMIYNMALFYRHVGIDYWLSILQIGIITLYTHFKRNESSNMGRCNQINFVYRNIICLFLG